MRHLASDITTHLKRGLQPFYFVYGEEPFQRMEACDQIRAAASNQGYTERECHEITGQFDWAGFKAKLSALSLFSNKRLIECRFREDKIGKMGAQALLEIATSPPPDTLFLCSVDKLDPSLRKVAWFTALEQRVMTLWAKPLSRDAFSQWLKTRLQQAQVTFTTTVHDILMERTEGNLLAAAQAIEKLRLHSLQKNDLNVEEINQLISVDTQFSIFDLVDALLIGTVSRTKQIFSSLKTEGIEPLLILWAITREVRTIIPLAQILEKGGSLAQGFREHKVWQHKTEGIRIFLNRSSLSFLHQCLIQAKNLDELFKGKRLGNEWSELYSLCLMLARGRYVQT